MQYKFGLISRIKCFDVSIEKKINLLSFGLVLNFMELETKTKTTFNSTSLKMGFNGQIYGDPTIILTSPNMASMWIQPNHGDRAKDAIYGYSYGREFTKNINKENGDVEVDNDKFIAAYLELGKSYIDNMTELMAPSK